MIHVQPPRPQATDFHTAWRNGVGRGFGMVPVTEKTARIIASSVQPKLSS